MIKTKGGENVGSEINKDYFAGILACLVFEEVGCVGRLRRQITCRRSGQRRQLMWLGDWLH